MKKLYIALLFLLCSLGIKSQQDPQYTQYMYNMSIINPAYTTNETGMINFGTLFRSQWQNAEGAPETLTFFAHAPLSDKVETGISLITDNIGDGVLKENNVYVDFAYILKLNADSNLSLGLKGGITNFETNFTGFRLPEFQDDAAFNENVNSIFPNVGVGAFYTRPNFYAGVSAPNLLTSKHLENRDGINRIGSEEIHLFFTSGYIYELNPNLKIKPSIMTKMVAGSPISLDTSVNVLFNNRFEGGLSYRLEDAVSAMFNISVVPAIRIGYAYDYTLSNLGSFNAGSHEIFALFDLDLLGLKKGYDKSPRFY
ncbi:type IX secretion system membrane protein PorP/SprF [Flagellimonas sp. HMM57]|uniref:PorP/SprF family type IX secretion system membrane protein n=1 Tax=unclassified Flagellimonas TaxID=2644544 RepID=UPI0013D452F2|nr:MULTISPECIES: type IX secretion system membrane protein PorP/SprF [unclassified Flagellimonas]UII74914.1 type IX secretion system membrane protein PorP/SprF [Flagellimonas sp. HMM57]